MQKLEKAIYLNANIIYSEAVSRVKNKKNTTLLRLKAHGYDLFSSVLVRMEVIQNLRKHWNLSIDQSRYLYNSIIRELDITELLVNTVHLTADFLDTIARTRLSLKDAIHLELAHNFQLKVCSHDIKMKAESIYEDKKRYYDNIFKPEELMNQK